MRRRLLLAVLCLTIAVTPLQARKLRAVGTGATIHLGALLDKTGDWATLGLASEAALEIAVRDINAEFTALAIPFRVQATVFETGLSPARAVEGFHALADGGAAFIIGPQSSSEAGAVRELAGAENVMVISQGSTASTLAIAGDNLFRLAPNDRQEGAGTASLMRRDGMKVVVNVWREDAGNIGLHTSTRDAFIARGGNVAAGIPYATTVTDFAPTVAAIGTAVRGAKATYPLAEIAVYLAAFDEAVQIFDLARLDADLAAVRWYGGDGVAQSQALLANAAVADFAAAVSFTAPAVGLDEAMRDLWEPVSEEIEERVGFVPDAFALSVYDAAWAAALSAVHVRGSQELRRESFVRTIQRYWGITGPTALDEAGDRRIGNFDFWLIENVDGTRRWVRSAQYVNGAVVD